MKTLFQISTGLLVLLSQACSPQYYIPNTQNVPVITAQGDNMISVAGNGNQFELQGAYGITEHLAVQVNGGYVFPKNEDNGSGGDGKFIEGGIGYYTNINEAFLFDVYALAGAGAVENHFPGTVQQFPATTGKITASIARFGLQPSLSYHTRFFSVSASARMSSLNYSKVEGSLIFDNEDQIAYLKDNNSTFLIEPALTLRGGFERIKLQLQLMRSWNLSNNDFKQDDGLVTLGLSFKL